MEYKKDNSLDGISQNDHAQEGSQEDISPRISQESLSKDSSFVSRQGSLLEDSPFVSRQGSLSEDSPFVSRQGSLSEDSPFFSRQGSLSEDSPFVSRQGSLSEDSPFVNRQESLSEDRPHINGQESSSENSFDKHNLESISKTSSYGSRVEIPTEENVERNSKESTLDDHSHRDYENNQSGGRTLAKVLLAVLIAAALFMVFTIIKRSSITTNKQIDSPSSVQEDADANEINSNETEEAEETELETAEKESEEDSQEESEEESQEVSEEESQEEENAPVADQEEAAEQKEWKERFDRASQLGSSDALTEDDFAFFDREDNKYEYHYNESRGTSFMYEFPDELDPDDNSDESKTITPRGISLDSTREDVEMAYGYPDASGTVSDECRFYYLLHDFEGEGDEVLQKQADWHLGLDYYEYYYKEACISFDFDENGGVAAIAIDTKSRMFW